MHLEILAEDRSTEIALDALIPKILGTKNRGYTFTIHASQGIGQLPSKTGARSRARDRSLLGRLQQKLAGYGKRFANYQGVVVVVCDLDDRDREEFLAQLQSILDACNPKPKARFFLAIEELEAWFLGDIPAIKAAYPRASRPVLREYRNDSICGTWELLARAIHGKKASDAMARAGTTRKSEWAEKISAQMQVEHNNSPSFRDFRDSMRQLIRESP